MATKIITGQSKEVETKPEVEKTEKEVVEKVTPEMMMVQDQQELDPKDVGKVKEIGGVE